MGLCVLILPIGARGQSKTPPTLSDARQAYNARRYDQAIALAEQARSVPALAPAAAVVLARSHLERFRQSSATGDLDAAREELKSVDAAALDPRDRVELFIAYGVSLYLDEQYSLDDRYSAAAEQFEVALSNESLLDAGDRDLVFDWWAGSLDRQAQQGTESGRRLIYQRVLSGAERELAANTISVAASYWLVAAARGVDDLTRASGAAAAAWIRAGSLGTRGAALRGDLDRLMRQVVLPERARELATSGDARAALALLERQWEELKGKWEN